MPTPPAGTGHPAHPRKPAEHRKRFPFAQRPEARFFDAAPGSLVLRRRGDQDRTAEVAQGQAVGQQPPVESPSARLRRRPVESQHRALAGQGAEAAAERAPVLHPPVGQQAAAVFRQTQQARLAAFHPVEHGIGPWRRHGDGPEVPGNVLPSSVHPHLRVGRAGSLAWIPSVKAGAAPVQHESPQQVAQASHAAPPRSFRSTASSAPAASSTAAA
jgi:hypothetical protein